MLKMVAENFLLKDKKEEFIKHALLLASESRKKEGCISYLLCEDVEDELHLSFIEEWKDEEAIKAHQDTKHYISLVPKLKECCAKSGAVWVYSQIL